ncbi:MAG: rRNA maturation RNase YbeY [Candidatus Paceibacterota bacterium]
MEKFSLARTTRTPLPRIPFKRIKEFVVGKKMSVTLIFIGEQRSRELNMKTRKKEGTANILTFPLSKESGEIYITPSRTKRDAQEFGLSHREFLVFLFIHGLLHLKGVSHGSTMERKEEELFKKVKKIFI